MCHEVPMKGLCHMRLDLFQLIDIAREERQYCIGHILDGATLPNMEMQLLIVSTGGSATS